MVKHDTIERTVYTVVDVVWPSVFVYTRGIRPTHDISTFAFVDLFGRSGSFKCATLSDDVGGECECWLSVKLNGRGNSQGYRQRDGNQDGGEER